jgi:hypothetical protein
MKQTIAIPEGCKATILTAENIIIIEEIRKENEPVDLTSFEGCCSYLDIGTVLPDVSGLPEKHANAIVSNYKLWVIAEAWNKQDGFVPNYSNNQKKYYPRFYKCSPVAFAFDRSICDLAFADAGSGSRLAFKTPERSREFGKMFIDLHNDVLSIDPLYIL